MRTRDGTVGTFSVHVNLFIYQTLYPFVADTTDFSSPGRKRRGTRLDVRGTRAHRGQKRKTDGGRVVVSTYIIMLHPLIISHPPTPTPGLKGWKQTLPDLPSDWTSQDGASEVDWTDDPEGTFGGWRGLVGLHTGV